jgi:hypothetical protein
MAERSEGQDEEKAESVAASVKKEQLVAVLPHAARLAKGGLRAALCLQVATDTSHQYRAEAQGSTGLRLGHW